MRARRTCGGKDYDESGAATNCPRLAEPGKSLCKHHEQVYETRRGTASQRGYDSKHRRWRAAAIRRANGTNCPLCGGVMLANGVGGDALEAEHSTPLVRDGASRADRIVHARCNPRGGAGMR